MKKSEEISALFESCKQGDNRAWRGLVEKYENLVYSTALLTGLSEEDAGEVHQQVWVELHRSMLRIKDPKALPSWLITTTRRIAYRHAVLSRRWVSEVRENMTDPRPGPDATLLLIEQRWRLEEALGGLDERCRELLELYFFEEENASYRELAAKFSIKEDSIGSLKTRCLRRLRQLLEKST